MGKEIEILEHWNDFVRAMMEAKKEWKAFTELISANRNTEGMPVRAQKVMNGVQWRAHFEIGIPRFIDYWRGYGGLEAMLLEEEQEELELMLGEEKGE